MYRFLSVALLLLLSVPVHAGENAIGEVNALRAARGLPPLTEDAGLTAGALNVADFRAQRGILGHTASDSNGLPIGVTCRAFGCGWRTGPGEFTTCHMYGNWTRAGAAKAIGLNGVTLYQIFVK